LIHHNPRQTRNQVLSKKIHEQGFFSSDLVFGFAHRPRAFGLQARAATSIAFALPPVLLSYWDGAAGFSVSRFASE